jgi:hypothetical protein
MQLYQADLDVWQQRVRVLSVTVASARRRGEQPRRPPPQHLQHRDRSRHAPIFGEPWSLRRLESCFGMAKLAPAHDLFAVALRARGRAQTSVRVRQRSRRGSKVPNTRSVSWSSFESQLPAGSLTERADIVERIRRSSRRRSNGVSSILSSPVGSSRSRARERESRTCSARWRDVLCSSPRNAHLRARDPLDGDPSGYHRFYPPHFDRRAAPLASPASLGWHHATGALSGRQGDDRSSANVTSRPVRPRAPRSKRADRVWRPRNEGTGDRGGDAPLPAGLGHGA